MTDRELMHRSEPVGAARSESSVSDVGAFSSPVPLAVSLRRGAEASADPLGGTEAARSPMRRSYKAAVDDATMDRAGAVRRLFSRKSPKPTEELDSLASHKNPHYDESQKAPAKAKKLLGIEDGKYVGTPTGKFSAASSESKREGVAKIKAAEQEKAVHQPVADLGEIYAHTSMLEAEFKHQVAAIAGMTKGKAVFRPGGKMKSLDRSLEKLTADYGGDESRLVDLTGGSIAFERPEDLVLGFGAVRSNEMFKVVRIKNSLKKGESYGDINMSLEMGGADFDIEVDGQVKKEHYAGFIIELQLHLAPIIAAKAHAHKDYEEQRAIDAKNAGQKDKSQWSAEDRTAWQDLETSMKRTYGEAWDSLGEDPKAIAAKLAKAIPELKPS